MVTKWPVAPSRVSVPVIASEPSTFMSNATDGTPFVVTEPEIRKESTFWMAVAASRTTWRADFVLSVLAGTGAAPHAATRPAATSPAIRAADRRRARLLETAGILHI